MNIQHTSASTVRELGIPVRSLNWVRLLPGRNAAGDPILLACMGEDAEGMFVCEIDPDTGHCTQHYAKVPAASHPTACYMSPSTGVLYVGSSYAGHLHRFDPNLPPEQRRLEDLGGIDPALAVFPCRMDEAPDGRLWIGAYGGASMTCFNPADGTFTRYGRMDPVDMYFYPLCGKDSSVAGLVRMIAPHVVAINPKTGDRRTLGPTINPDDSSTNARDPGMLDLIKGDDGLLYITSDQGNWRIRGLEAEPVDTVPAPSAEPKWPDGSTVRFAPRPEFDFRGLLITDPDGATREVNLDWRSAGTNLFMMHLGPDDKLYGSSILPEHLFGYDPATDEVTDFGQCSESDGEVYSMANLDGLLYIHSYPAARLSIYDPAKPYRYGTQPGDNPRDVGRPDHVAYRPMESVAGPAGKVWTVSVPDYGLWGGTLTWYDPAAETFGSHRHLIKDCSPVTIDYLPDQNALLLGFNADGGTGTHPKAEHGGFVIWDPDADREIWQGTFGIERLATVNDLCRSDDGSVYAMVQQWVDPAKPIFERQVAVALARLDVASRCVLQIIPVPAEIGGFLSQGLVRSADGHVHGAGRHCLYRIKPGTVEIEPLHKSEAAIGAPGPVVGNRRYFAIGHRLMMAEW